MSEVRLYSAGGVSPTSFATVATIGMSGGRVLHAMFDPRCVTHRSGCTFGIVRSTWFEPSLDALGFWSDAMSSLKVSSIAHIVLGSDSNSCRSVRFY